ncbi:MAG: SAM-dependent methyltransferase [Bryobacteraceae bacterium]
MKRGVLFVVGTGIKGVGRITMEAQAAIEQADKALYLIGDPVMERWVQKLNPKSESLYVFYEEGKDRFVSYVKIVERILFHVREGLGVCAAFYGHPGVFSYSAHEAIRRARLEGFSAKMLPGISSQDCMFADLGLDPGRAGCQSFEATDFLIHRRKFDTRSALMIWQIGAIGELSFQRQCDPSDGLRELVGYLENYYDGTHEMVIYEASRNPASDPVIRVVLLEKLPWAGVTRTSTLYIPPKEQAVADPDMLIRLGLSENGAKTKDEFISLGLTLPYQKL